MKGWDKMREGLLERINELARKKRREGLTAEEETEQKRLYKEYLTEFRKGMEQTLDHTVLQRPDGSKVPLKRKIP